MTGSTLASFLRPEGFERPRVAAVLREGSALTEAGRYAARTVADRRARRDTPYASRASVRLTDPVVLVPGFLAGDGTLALMARSLRARGFRTYRSHMHANVGCTLRAAGQLEARLEAIASHRGSRVQIVGHSLGGMLARGLAVRRPDLVSGIVTMGSPMLAPGAHHVSLTASVEMLVRLSRAGVPGLMARECVAGACARESFEESREPVPDGVSFTAIYSQRDGIVDWRACVDPLAVPVEVTASHLGMAFDPRVIDHVLAALRRGAEASALEVDRGESA
ncbi:esterase/lipase family protein [Nocardioides sp. MAHUQ-72]|uniref:esterase/lipase family protein n=1 Tax=unclassified Nocardioides TaxID=2615069 RepID=UPI00361ACD9A